jgi:predicted PurR-regulated permease PerM
MNNKKIIIDFSPKTIIWVIASVVALWLILVIREVLVVIFLSYIFAAALDPLVDKLQRKKLPRALAILLLYLGIIAFLALFIGLVVPPAVSQINEFVQNSGNYVDKITSYFQHLNPSIRITIVEALSNAGNALGGINAGAVVGKVFGVFSGAVGFVAVFVIAFYLLLQKDGVEKAITAILPEKYHQKAFTVSRRISFKMSSWVRGQLFLAFIIFVINFIGLSILKVDMALTLALISGLLELLPIIGPIVAGVLATLIALTSSPLLALIVAVWYILVQQLENHILVPQIMKKSVGLNPILVIVAILIGGKVMGFWGVLIAVPVFACIAVIIEELKKKG